MSQALSKDYVLELLKCSITNAKVLDICSRYLKYEYLETPTQKKIVKYIFDTYNVSSSAPTLGAIAQAYSGDPEVIALLGKIKKVDTEGKDEVILSAFEDYVKDIRFQRVLHNVAKLYNEDKVKEAVEELATESKAIQDFTLKDRFYTKVFDQFDDRTKKRQNTIQSNESLLKERMTTGIHEFDQATLGGFKKGTSFLAMARSGVGKSTYLRWVALTNARLGKRVVFFQAESTEDETMESFDAAWTSIALGDVEDGHIPTDLLLKIRKVKNEIKSRGGEIIVIASEQFDQMSMEECREKLKDIIKVEGPVDMVLFDYLEIFTSKGMYGKGDAAERRRREDIANKMTNIATEFKVVVGSATQSADIDTEKLNNPDFKMTRHHASEFKNIIKPFSYFFTFNATEDEYRQQLLRVYVDKMRRHSAGQTIRIYQSRNNGRFYDAVRTKQEFSHAT